MTAADDDDELLFAEEDSGPNGEPAIDPTLPPWIILIVDDDPEVHAITRVVLGEMIYERRGVTFLSAHTAAEAKAILRTHADIATIFLDVVMETDDAGLKLVHFIREELGNSQVRIILRTGQPGQAPERQVIVSCDINDYKAKSELTAQKLFTATVSALRSYQHIVALERSRQGLEKIIDAAAALQEEHSLQRFVEGVVQQIAFLLGHVRGALLCVPAGDETGGVEILAASGVFDGAAGRRMTDALDGTTRADIAAALDSGHTVFRDGHCSAVFRTRRHTACVVHVVGSLTPIDRQLVEIFCSKVAAGLDNVYLLEQLRRTQTATVQVLGKLAEFKDEVTGEHVKRIERWTTLIARELQARGDFPAIVDDHFCEHIGLASILHDVGKVGIPDHILRKPGRLDPDEMTIMREHATIGGSVLREATRMVDGHTYLQLGADIAESHHEKWDGSGYPRGLSGDTIPLAGRIVAVADVYDALIHARPYKKAWEQHEVLDLLRRETGHHFDGRVVDAFFTVLEREQGR